MSIDNKTNCLKIYTVRKTTQKTREKMSQSQLDRFKKTPVWNKGKRGIYSKETLKKMSAARKGKPSPYKGRKWPQYSGSKHPNWRGGKIVHSQGYIQIYSPDHPNVMKNKYVFEHRLVMEEKLGRYLNSKEIVHHINGAKSDNRVQNLQLVKNTSEHRLIHRRKHNMMCKKCKRSRLHKARGYCGSCYNWWLKNR